ncbi:MAG: HNH endonuclease [Actinobacteria bacterium]|jgi:putative restriction endonuclease|nr:HNH endonuclease [Actinomycetota bacterium]
MKVYVGITDMDWYRTLAAQPDVREVNFWKPGGDASFKALLPGEPFLFKTHWPHNRIVGGGFFEGFARLPLSSAWDFFGAANGVSTLEEMRLRVGKYREIQIKLGDDPSIGCVLLNEVSFFPDAETEPAPQDFSKNIVQGKTYVAQESGSLPLIDLLVEKLTVRVSTAPTEKVATIDGPIFGQPRNVRPRLGQGGFKALVHGAYGDRCSVTGHKIRPTLQAAHILPVGKGGEHRIDNGLLLRSDVHTLFDRGYIGVDPTFKLHVSKRLRDEFGNGDEFYERAGSMIALPERKIDQPNAEFLTWHMDQVFLAG